MIPTIETIVDDLVEDSITKQQAIAWLHIHAEDAGSDLRDAFASAALTGMLANSFLAERYGVSCGGVTKECYLYADEMLEARKP